MDTFVHHIRGNARKNQAHTKDSSHKHTKTDKITQNEINRKKQSISQ